MKSPVEYLKTVKIKRFPLNPSHLRIVRRGDVLVGIPLDSGTKPEEIYSTAFCDNRGRDAGLPEMVIRGANGLDEPAPHLIAFFDALIALKILTKEDQDFHFEKLKSLISIRNAESKVKTLLGFAMDEAFLKRLKERNEETEEALTSELEGKRRLGKALAGIKKALE